MLPEDMFSSTFGSGKVIRVVVFDTEVTILCFELHCVLKNVFASEAIHAYFSVVGGSGRMASQSADPAVPAGSGVGVGHHPRVRRLGVVKSVALEE